jgi:hypothetical protein
MKILAIFISICVCQTVSASSEEIELFPTSLVPFPFLNVSDAIGWFLQFLQLFYLVEIVSSPLLLQQTQEEVSSDAWKRECGHHQLRK